MPTRPKQISPAVRAGIYAASPGTLTVNEPASCASAWTARRSVLSHADKRVRKAPVDERLGHPTGRPRRRRRRLLANSSRPAREVPRFTGPPDRRSYQPSATWLWKITQPRTHAPASTASNRTRRYRLIPFL